MVEDEEGEEMGVVKKVGGVYKFREQIHQFLADR